MKQWLYNGWCAFRAWVLFNYWRHCTNENHDELLKFYILKRWEKNAMKAYVEYHNGKKFPEPESWYAGTLDPEKMSKAKNLT